MSSALAGDTSAFAELVDRYHRSVIAVAQSILRDQHLAEDTAQNVFVTVFQKLGSLRQGDRFGPWVRRIAKTKAIDECKRQSRRPEQSISNNAERPESDHSGRDREFELLKAVASLPESERDVVMLKYFDGLSVSEICSISGRSPGTVTKALSRAYNKLRQELRVETP